MRERLAGPVTFGRAFCSWRLMEWLYFRQVLPEQLVLIFLRDGGVVDFQVVVGGFGGAAALAGAADEARLELVRVADVDECVDVFAEAGGDGFNAGGASVVYLDQGAEVGAILFVEAAVVDAFKFEGGFGDIDRQLSFCFFAFDGGVITNSSKQAIGDAR